MVHSFQSGTVTVDEVISKITTILSDPDYHRGMSAVCDYSDATLDWSLADLNRLRSYLSRMKSQIGSSQWAIVIPPGKDTSTARLFIALHNAFSSSPQIELFRDHDTAQHWLQKQTKNDAAGV